MERLHNMPPQERMVVHISRDSKRWNNTAADIQGRAGDKLFIPRSLHLRRSMERFTTQPLSLISRVSLQVGI